MIETQSTADAAYENLQNKIGNLQLNSGFSLKTLAMADFFYKHGVQNSNILWCIAWLTQYTENSYTCINLTNLWQENAQFREFFADLNFADLIEQIQADAAVFSFNLSQILKPQKNEQNLPLVLVEQETNTGKIYNFYLNRLFGNEKIIKDYVAGAKQNANNALTSQEIETAKSLLDKLFPKDANMPIDWQKIAVAQMLNSKFGIITGGPGTGKTTTVIKLLICLKLLALAGENSKNLTLILAAPTGKAAARLSESLDGKIDSKELPEIQSLFESIGLQNNYDNWRELIPTQVSTVHKILGASAPGKFKNSEESQIEADILVIDEASMLDIYTMSVCLSSLKPKTRVFLLGDENQLNSVEAGAILGDLCALQSDKYSPEQAEFLVKLTGEQIGQDFIQQDFTPKIDIARLRHSYRFDAKSGIGKLADLVNNQCSVDEFLTSINQYEDLEIVDIKANYRKQILQIYAESWREYFALLEQKPVDSATDADWDTWCNNLFEKFSQFQFLACLRSGDYGLENINKIIADEFAKTHKYGEPYLITKNDKSMDIANGDIALLLPYRGNLQLHLQQNGKIKRIAYSRVENLELAWCLTVHKSQGSEFSTTALIMPEQASALLTKEILYTAITRSKIKFKLLYNTKNKFSLEQSLQSKVQRSSGF